MAPIHPITVHFTIALFSLAVLFEILGWLLKKESLRQAAWWNHLFAVAAVIVTVLSGRAAAATAPHNESIHRVIEIHETLGYIVLGGILVLFAWRTVSRGKYLTRMPLVYAIAGLLSLGVMTVGAYYGGELVFTHGMGVKPMMERMASQPHEHSGEGGQEAEHGEMMEQNEESETEEHSLNADPDKPGTTAESPEHEHGSHSH